MSSTIPRSGELPLDAPTSLAPTGTPPNPLSEREMDVARLLATGASNTEIARDLVISPHTVKVHLRNIFEKLEVNSRTEATMALVQHGWLEVEGVVRMEGAAQNGSAVDVVAQPEIREPEPLADLQAHPAPWQRVWLVAALIGAIILVVVPWMVTPAASSAPLLSDVSASDRSIAPITLYARWVALAPMPQARSRHAVARQQRVIYSFGGESMGGELLDSVVGLDLDVNRWRTFRSLPVPLSNLAAATVGDVIYVAGGTLASSIDAQPDGANAASGINGADAPAFNDKLWRFDPAENEWSELGNLPVAVAGASLLPAKYNDEDALILAGGWDGERVRDEVWLLPIDEKVIGTSAISESVNSESVTSETVTGNALNTDTLNTDTLNTDSSISAFTSPLLSPTSDARWMLLTRLPVARAFMGAAVVGDELYTVGGFDGTQELADADRFNVVSGRWESLPSLNTGRSGLALVYDDVGLHALGGGWLQNVDTNERFDLATGTWAIVPSSVAGSWRHLGAVAADGALFLMGGWNGDYMDLVTSYQSTFRSLLPVITNP